MNEAEARRVAAVYDTGLMDTPAEGRFDRITRIARRLLNAPIALVTLVDDERQFLKSSMGLIGVLETPCQDSICSRAISQDEIYLVPDASRDPLFKDSKLVTGHPHIRAYAGKPLRYDGERIGALCVIDTNPREFTAAECQDICDLALWVESEIDSERQSNAQIEMAAEVDRLREMAMVDNLTRTWNRAGLSEVFSRELSQAEREKDAIGVIVADIDHFKSVNDTYGHDVGDVVLKRVADRIRLSVRPYDSIGRTGGEEFVVVLPKSHGPTAERVAERIRSAVEAEPIEMPDGEKPLPVTLSLGVASARCRPGFAPSLARLTKAADQALYQAKAEGRNRVVAAPEVKPE